MNPEVSSLLDEVKVCILSMFSDAEVEVKNVGDCVGGLHLSLKVLSSSFNDKSQVDRHRLIYKALGSLMDRIHALKIRALTKEEGFANVE